MSGLLGTPAPIASDVNLVLQIIIVIILLVGFKYGKTKTASSLKTHGRIMTVVVILNAASILLVMGPVFVLYFGAVLAEPFVIGFPLTLVHHSIGIIAEILGAVLVFKKFGNVRMWMRLTLVLWLISWVLGVFFYIWYYVPAF